MVSKMKWIILCGLILIILSPENSIAQAVPTPAAPLTPNKEHLAILKQGVSVWNKWRKETPDVKPELSKANLSGFELREANLSKANLRGANLLGADLCESYLNEADLRGVDFYHANLSQANLRNTDMTGAKLSGAKLYNADLEGANLTAAVLTGTDLSRVNLNNTKLCNADLRLATLRDALFNPISTPSAQYMFGISGLSTLRAWSAQLTDRRTVTDIAQIVNLREDYKNSGYRDMERDVTCAIERIRNSNSSRPWYARAFYYVAFDLTSSYGADPQKPFWILLWVFIVGGFLQIVLFMTPKGGSLFVDFRLKYKDKYATIKLDWTPHGLYPKMSPEPTRSNRYPKAIPNRYLMKFKRPAITKWRAILRVIGRVIRIVLYFSLLSTFNIGYKEFNVGSWVGRLQKRQYTLRARGWLRVVSGAQSLLGVYLLALWILCTFGRPFG